MTSHSDKEFINPLNSGHLRVLKKSVIKRCPLLGGSLTKTVIFGTKHFVHYSRHVRYLGYPLLGGFTVLYFNLYLMNMSSTLNKVQINKQINR